MKVYLVVLEYVQFGLNDVDIRVAETLEKAHEIFKELEQESIVASLLKENEYCERDEYLINAYDYDDSVLLHIIEKVVE